MGRPPSNGAPSFRFNPTEVAQMEAILKKHEGHVPPRDLLVALAHRFSQSPERAGKMVVQMKQVWNWFQNRRYALRAKSVEPSGKPGTSPVTAPQAMNVPSVPQQMAVSSGPHVAGNTSEAPTMEYEAKSARDGAWYDVQMFISLRSLDTENPEVLVRFAGFGPEEDEWVNIVKHVRPRSLPCEASECIVVCPGDLILCFQEGKEQALYFDAHVLDAQRRRHDVRGCRCRFLVRYDHDQSEEIVPLRKICRRPDTDYRLQQLNNAANDAPAPTSAPVGPAKPVVSTSTTSLGMTNPSASAATVSQSSIIGARPSVRPPPASAPTLVQAPNVRLATTPIPTSVPTSTRATSFGTSTPAVRPPMSDQKKAENVNPAQISVPDQKVACVNPAQVSVPVLKKAEVEQVPVSSPTLAESVNSAPVSLPVPKKAEAEQVSVFDPKMAETVNPAQISVTEPKKVEAEQVSVCIPKMAESVDPAHISVTDPKKAEAEQVSVCIPKMAESVDPAHISVTDPKKAEAEQVLVHTPKIAESVNPVSISAIDPKTAENVVPVQISIPGPKMAESVSVMPTPVVVSVPEVNKVEVVSPTPVLAPLSGPSKVETDIPSSAPVQVPVPVPETIKVEGDNAAVVSVTELNKVASDIPVSDCGLSQVETVIPAFAPVQVPETNKVASDVPVYVPEPNEVVSDMSVSIPEPNKAEGDISIAAATEPNKVEGDIPASAPEPNKTEGDIPVSAPAASVNLGTSDSEAGAQANISTTGAVTKILEANEADNINVPEEQLSDNPAITVPGPEPQSGTETVTTVTGNTEPTLGN